MNDALTDDAKLRLQSTRLVRRVLLAFFSVLILAALALAGVLLAGWRAAKKELATIHNGDLLKLWSEIQLVDTGAPAKTFAPVLRAAEARSDYRVPINPYTGKGCVEYHRGSDQYIGDFSYVLALDHWGYLEGSAIVMYSPMPTVAQRRYCQLFMHPYLNYDPDMSRAGPKVDWIGGECGNCYYYLARGLAPADAIAELNRMYKAADPYDTEDLRDELIFLTPEDYAAKINKTPQAGVSGAQLSR